MLYRYVLFDTLVYAKTPFYVILFIKWYFLHIYKMCNSNLFRVIYIRCCASLFLTTIDLYFLVECKSTSTKRYCYVFN